MGVKLFLGKDLDGADREIIICPVTYPNTLFEAPPSLECGFLGPRAGVRVPPTVGNPWRFPLPNLFIAFHADPVPAGGSAGPAFLEFGDAQVSDLARGRIRGEVLIRRSIEPVRDNL